MAGMQIIGWDEAKEQIRSWTFDSDGGFNQRAWEKAGERWSVQQTATLPDGTLASSTSLLTPLDENSFTWQQVSRVVGANHPLQLFQLFVGMAVQRSRVLKCDQSATLLHGDAGGDEFDCLDGDLQATLLSRLQFGLKIFC